MKNKTTSWGQVADWYESYLSGPDTFQEKVIKPNLLRLLELKRGETVLDLACGSGFFARALAEQGARVIGVDLSPELVSLAREQTGPRLDVSYLVSPSHQLKEIADASIDKAIIVLALQNISEAKGTLAELRRALKSDGKIYLVLNHPAFRVPKRSSWGWDEEEKVQYRRIDEYLSESKVEIVMHPSSRRSKAEAESTISFHRPLQYYFKLLSSSGFAVTRLEEWVSHKESEPGKRSKAENKARHEFPLFLFLEALAIL